MAGTPPLKALPLVISLAASKGWRLAFFDVVAAFVHAVIDELVILLLPDGLGAGRTAVLYKALYGTRKASRLWRRFLRDVLAEAGWKASVIFASMYTVGEQRGTRGCWGDDLLIEVYEMDLDAVEAHRTNRLEVKVLTRIGGKQSGEVEFLKRVLRYDSATGGFTWCNSKRYVQDAASILQLTGRAAECNAVNSPGTKGVGGNLRDADQKLDEDDTAAFWSALGSVMYVAMDRPEILYATKTVASFMQSPTRSALVKLKRLARYLVGFLQAEWVHSRQAVPKYLDVYGDSDWDGDEERKRSTTGIAEIFGGHLLDAVSATQTLVALSSAEAEFYACNRGTAGGLQTYHFLSEAVYQVIPRVWSDSSACRGIVRRTGTGKLRHLEIGHMWARERLQKGEFLLKAVPRRT